MLPISVIRMVLKLSDKENAGLTNYDPRNDSRITVADRQDYESYAQDKGFAAGKSGAHAGGAGGGAAAHAADASKSGYKMPRLPRFLASKYFLGLLGMVYFNSQMQKAEMKNYSTMIKFERTELPQVQNDPDGPIEAAVRVINYNMITQKNDTVYGLIVNKDRMVASLGKTGNHSNKTPLSKEMLENTTVYNFSNMGASIKEFDEVKNKSLGFKWKYQFRKDEGKERGILGTLKDNAVGLLFPTGAVVVSSQAWNTDANIFNNIDPDLTGDDVHGFSKLSNGTMYEHTDKLDEYRKSAEFAGLIKLKGKEEFEKVVSGKKIGLDAIK